MTRKPLNPYLVLITAALLPGSGHVVLGVANRGLVFLFFIILLGWGSGFDSGRTLDYVYENKPRGFTWLGRLIDKNYLNSIGWRGIRVRREFIPARSSRHDEPPPRPRRQAPWPRPAPERSSEGVAAGDTFRS